MIPGRKLYCNSLHIQFVIFLLLQSVYLNKANSSNWCKLKPPPKGNYLDSVQYEFLSLLKHENLFGQRYFWEDNNGKFTYEFAICAPALASRPNVSLIRREKVEEEEWAIGLRNATTISAVQGEWILLNLNAGDPDTTSENCKKTSLSSSVMFRCDPNYSTGKFRLIYQDTKYCTFLFEVRLAAICGKLPGMSGWSIFFIILLVSFLCYFIGGVLYLRIQRGAKGVEQIPHRTFWFTIGNKLADGCSAFCRCDQYCSDGFDQGDSRHSPYSGGYSPIGGSSPTTPAHNSERDAPLLHP